MCSVILFLVNSLDYLYFSRLLLSKKKPLLQFLIMLGHRQKHVEVEAISITSQHYKITSPPSHSREFSMLHSKCNRLFLLFHWSWEAKKEVVKTYCVIISSEYVSLFPFQNSDRRYPCTYPNCGAIFKYYDGYRHHMKRHQGIYLYQCPYCQKGLSSTNATKHHLKSQHTGQFGYHCIKCQLEFGNIHQLKTHLELNNCSR